MPERGDIGSVRYDKGLFARGILFVEAIRRRQDGLDPHGVWACHTVVYIGNGMIVQATPTVNPFKLRGVICSEASGLPASTRWSTGRDLGAPGDVVADHAVDMLGIPYGLLDILAFLLAIVGWDPKFVRTRLNRPDRLFCSQVACRAVRLARQYECIVAGMDIEAVLKSDLGIVPGQLDSEQTPDDVDRWVQTLPVK